MGACRYCGQDAGFLRRQHRECRDLHAQGMAEMTQLAAQAAGFDEGALRSALQFIAARTRATGDDVAGAIAAGWTRGIQDSISDGAMTREEEDARLRDFRGRMAALDHPEIVTGSDALERAAAKRTMAKAGRAA